MYTEDQADKYRRQWRELVADAEDDIKCNVHSTYSEVILWANDELQSALKRKAEMSTCLDEVETRVVKLETMFLELAGAK